MRKFESSSREAFDAVNIHAAEGHLVMTCPELATLRGTLRTVEVTRERDRVGGGVEVVVTLRVKPNRAPNYHEVLNALRGLADHAGATTEEGIQAMRVARAVAEDVLLKVEADKTWND